MANIKLDKLTANTIVLTLFEKTTLSPAYYLIEFINKQTFIKSYCIPTELSTEIPRYNKFVLTDSLTPNPLTGGINLQIGSFEYNVYEQSSTTNLNPSGLTIVESGIGNMYDVSTNTNTSYPSTAVTNTRYE